MIGKFPIGYRYIQYRQLKSTNDFAKEVVHQPVFSKFLQNASRVIIRAEHQTDGRGRYSRSWQSSRGNLACSLVMNMKEPGGVTASAGSHSFYSGKGQGEHHSNIEIQHNREYNHSNQKHSDIMFLLPFIVPLAVIDAIAYINKNINSNNLTEDITQDMLVNMPQAGVGGLQDRGTYRDIIAKIKFPNDILLKYDGKMHKFCGFLLENIKLEDDAVSLSGGGDGGYGCQDHGRCFIIGIGANLIDAPQLDNVEFPPIALGQFGIHLTERQFLYIFCHFFEENLKLATESAIGLSAEPTTRYPTRYPTRPVASLPKENMADNIKQAKPQMVTKILQRYLHNCYKYKEHIKISLPNGVVKQGIFKGVSGDGFLELGALNGTIEKINIGEIMS